MQNSANLAVLPTEGLQQKVHHERELKTGHYLPWQAAIYCNSLNCCLHIYIMQFSSFSLYIQFLLPQKVDYNTNKRKRGVMS